MSVQALRAILVEVSKAESALWNKPETVEAQQALRRCEDHLHYRGEECLADVKHELELADLALQGKNRTAETRAAIRRSLSFVSALINEKATPSQVA